MAEKFVYPMHPAYEPYRKLASTAELEVHQLDEPSEDDGREIAIQYRQVEVPIETVYPIASDWTDEETDGIFGDDLTPTEYFWWAGGGINTLSGSKSWPEGFTNEGYRVISDFGPAPGNYTPQAGELISHGVGLLRPLEFVKSSVCSRERAESAFIVNSLVHVVKHPASYEGDGRWGGADYRLASTNLITPEVLGELQQLSERINDTAFLEAYLHDLLATFTLADVTDGDDIEHQVSLPSLRYKIPVWREAAMDHLSQGIWSTPPVTVPELRMRIKYLIDQIRVDDSALPSAA